MKKNNTQIFIIFILFNFFAINIYAQLSKGGTPKGFSPKVNQAIPIAKMPVFDPAAMLLEDETLNAKGNGPFRFGKNFDVNYNLSNAGSWFTYPNGDRLWQLEIASTNAYSINLQFSYFKIPPDAELYIYNTAKTMVLGAFTDINNQEDNLFATDLVQGSNVIVEYFEPSQVRGLGAFNISTITHAYRNIFDTDKSKGYGTSGACQFNTVCPLSAGWEEQIRSAVMLVTGGNGFCSASLVNNTANDGKPYILTANHCGSSGFGSWVFRFNWESTTCVNSGNPTYLSLSGGIQRANSAGSDMSLVEITGGLNGGLIPSSYNAYFSGWSNLNVPADSAFGIHHPDGDIKKFSIAKNATITSTMSGATCWRVGQWTKGCTEGGSSGSPLYDQNHRIVGQLYGGPSYCGAPAASMNDNYGKFYTSWLGGGTNATQLKFWLDPNNINTTGVIDGYDPNAISVALDGSVLSISSPASGLNTCNTNITPIITIKNRGFDTLTSLIITYNIDAQAPLTYNYSGNLLSNAIETVTLLAINGLSPGAHTLTVSCSLPNGSADQNITNDQQQITFTIITPTPLVNTPTFQGAETSPFPGSSWSILNPNNNTTWVAKNGTSGFNQSTKCFYFNNYSTDLTGQSDYLVSPFINLNGTVAPLLITFNVAYARYTATAGVATDSLLVTVSKDCGTTWNRIYYKGGTGLSSIGGLNTNILTTAFTPDSGQWKSQTISITNLIGEDNVVFRFENKSAYGNNLYIDDINIGALNDVSVRNNESDGKGILIYPNPSQGIFNIQIINEKVNSINVYNAIGTLVYSYDVPNNYDMNVAIKTPQLNAGVYFVKVKTNTSSSTQRIIVTK